MSSDNTKTYNKKVAVQLSPIKDLQTKPSEQDNQSEQKDIDLLKDKKSESILRRPPKSAAFSTLEDVKRKKSSKIQ